MEKNGWYGLEWYAEILFSSAFYGFSLIKHGSF